MTTVGLEYDELSLAEQLALLDPDQQANELRQIAPTPELQKALLWDWSFWCRPKQRIPDADDSWDVWLLLAGRGFGKTRSIAEFARHKAYTMPKSRGAIVSSTAADARDIIVEGESGVLSVCPPWFQATYEPSKRRITWPNGSMATLFTAVEPDRLRGPQHHWAIADELAAWRYAQDAWDMLMLGLRLGDHPVVGVATTPRPLPIIKNLMNDARTKVVRGTTYENITNLAPVFINQIIKRYEGTRLGAQELLAQLLIDTPGALWTYNRLEENRRRRAPEEGLARIVVGVDPAVTSKEESAETGIIISGLDEARHGWCLDDQSGRYTPAEWGRRVVQAYDFHSADLVVAEVNNGGDLVEHVVRTAAQIMYEAGERTSPHISYKSIRATRGKFTRAEPISSLDEQHQIHHVGMLPYLEDQLCTWVPGDDSPDRLDAYVWSFTELMLEGPLTTETLQNPYW